MDLSEGHRQKLATERHETSYLIQGRPDAPPIIFLHGWPGLSNRI